jgi:hypothetical protein
MCVKYFIAIRGVVKPFVVIDLRDKLQLIPMK